jgi:hypothetical protein
MSQSKVPAQPYVGQCKVLIKSRFSTSSVDAGFQKPATNVRVASRKRSNIDALYAVAVTAQESDRETALRDIHVTANGYRCADFPRLANDQQSGREVAVDAVISAVFREGHAHSPFICVLVRERRPYWLVGRMRV